MCSKLLDRYLSQVEYPMKWNMILASSLKGESVSLGDTTGEFGKRPCSTSETVRQDNFRERYR